MPRATVIVVFILCIFTIWVEQLVRSILSWSRSAAEIPAPGFQRRCLTAELWPS